VSYSNKILPAAFALAGFAFCHPALSDTVPAAAGLTVSVNSTANSYSLQSANPAWSFSGTVDGSMTHVSRESGRDPIGAYSETSFQWDDGHPFVGTIRVYTGQSVALFSIKSTDVLAGPTPDFPSFNTIPSNLKTLSFRDSNFSPHEFSLAQTSTPWILFDGSADTAVLSPASDFIVSQMHGGLDTTIGSGIQPTIASLPVGFTHLTLLTVGVGIETTIHHWGDALTALSGKPEPSDDSDLMLKYLGYWTDNGAVYYYNYDFNKGYTGTLLAVKDEFKSENIPLKYFQLDSWWYQKTRTSPNGRVGGPKNAKLPDGNWNAYGGTLDYSASPALFPQGLKKFDDDLGVPIAVHGRWIDPTSPYHAQYQISGIAPIDPRYWDDRAKYLADSGVFCYEQDWLIDLYQYSPEMATDLTVGNAFTDNMARAAKANGETLQYCMATPRFFLQGSRYDNLTTIRTSDDYFVRERWNNFFYTSIFANALHIRPWTDVLMSAELGNIAIATLSSGPVGIGDKMGTESIPNIMKSIRGDGAIIKPDAPLLPTDSSILNDDVNAHLPLVASTYTDNGQKTVYVFAFTRTGDSSAVSFTPSSLGLSGKVYVTALSGASKEQDSSDPFADTLDADGWALYSVAPVGKSGIAFLGDANKFVGTGRQRITSIVDKPSGLTVQVVLSLEESSTTLAGYSETAPKVSVSAGTAGPVDFNAQSGYFTVTITKPASLLLLPLGADALTRLTAVFTLGRR
jgi:hypothetical protein